MHRLLMERGAIIDRLIAVKKTADSGSAFRPGREAAMMRALAERHEGLLPLDTVEGIWRVIIATFTYRAGALLPSTPTSPAATRRCATRPASISASRCPIVAHASAAAVIEAVAGSRGRSRHLPARPGRLAPAPGGATLAGAGRPKVIARLPFIERPDHPAGTPVFVISKPLADAAVRDVVLYAARFERWRDGAPARVLARLGGEVIASAGEATGLSVLLAAAGVGRGRGRSARRSPRPGVGLAGLVEVGSHAERFRVK